jgi:nicotinamidase-related amidase
MAFGLLVIDLQVLMVDAQDPPFARDRVIGNVAALLDAARAAGAPVVYVQHTDTTELVRGTAVWQIHPAVAPIAGETVVEKHSWDAFLETPLRSVLIEKGIDSVAIVGMQSQFCIDTSTRGAYANGFRKNVLVSDAHTTFDTPAVDAERIVAHENATLGGRFAALATTAEVIARFRG